MECKDSIEFPQLPGPRKLLQYVQRRWLLNQLHRLNRWLEVMLAAMQFAIWMIVYGAANSVWRVALKVKLRADGGAKHAQYIMQPWKEWGGMENVLIQREYDRMDIAYASMTVEDRIAMARNTPVIVPNVGLENGAI